jgi:hypothetical protein
MTLSFPPIRAQLLCRRAKTCDFSSRGRRELQLRTRNTLQGLPVLPGKLDIPGPGLWRESRQPTLCIVRGS